MDRSEHEKGLMPTILGKARDLPALPFVVNVVNSSHVFFLAWGILGRRGKKQIRSEFLRIKNGTANVANGPAAT
jgi:hypothetical protein